MLGAGTGMVSASWGNVCSDKDQDLSKAPPRVRDTAGAELQLQAGDAPDPN